MLAITSAGSPGNLARRAIRFLFCDEVDKYPATAGAEGNPISLARKRLATFRHSWASHMLASGADLAYVSNQLGHANPSITLRIYSHWVPGTRRVTTSILDTKPASAPEINSPSSCSAKDFKFETRPGAM